jgi:hypothetical protein
MQVTVVMPVVAPIMKISQCQEMGANVIVHGATIAEVIFFPSNSFSSSNSQILVFISLLDFMVYL